MTDIFLSCAIMGFVFFVSGYISYDEARIKKRFFLASAVSFEAAIVLSALNRDLWAFISFMILSTGSMAAAYMQELEVLLLSIPWPKPRD